MMDGFGMGMMGFGMLVFWVLVVVGIVLLVRWLADETRRKDSPFARRDRAVEIARERLARGEISPEEYETLRGHLEG